LLEDLGNLGDFIGGLAVIVTLIYLANQVRQNTAALRTSSQQEINSGFRRWNDVLLRPGVREAYSLGIRDYPDMPAEQKGMFAIAFSDHVNNVQGAYSLYKGGLLDSDTYLAHRYSLACQIVTPGGLRHWEETRAYYPAPFVKAMDDCVSAGGIPDILTHPYFQLDGRPN